MDAKFGSFTVFLLLVTCAQLVVGNNSTDDESEESTNGPVCGNYTYNSTTPDYDLDDLGTNNSTSDDESSQTSTNKTAFEYIQEANCGQDIEIHEFDMRFPKAQSDSSEDQHDAPIRDRSALWPGGVIPYEYGNSIRNQRWFVKLIQDAMNEWEAKTCIKFRPKSSYDPNYVHIHIGNGCNSDVGMVGGRQSISLGNGCAHHSVILHELGHVVGFWHEQNRPDRDRYIKILRKNIIKRLYFAFHKYSTHKIDSLGVPYDYKSIMHYSRKSFSKNRKDTIVAIDPKVKDFGNNHLSVLDVIQARRLYKCADKTQQYPSFPEDFKFSLTRLSSHRCTRLYEPHDRYWRRNRRAYLCVKSGRKPLNIRWSYTGALSQMTCTRVYSNEKHYYSGWNDNYLCVPVRSPYKFKWSVNGPISGQQCMQWRYSADRRWGSTKYLCAESDDKPVDGGWSPWSLWSQCTKKCGTGYQHRKRECTNPRPKNRGRTCGTKSYETRYCNKRRCEDLPNWPVDFAYRYHPYTPSSSTCIRTYERANYFQWTNYYFCSRAGRRDINMKWSDNGPIRNMKCVLINEPQEPRRNGWYNNWLCVPKSSPYNFRWSHSGIIPGLSCIRWYAKKGYDGWSNNYLCAAKPIATTPKPKAIHGGWTRWSVWTSCTKTCDTGTRMRFRSCSNPYPQNGGRTCRGAREIKENCKLRNCPRTICDKKYSGHTGTFRSPVKNQGQISCTWTIQAPPGYKIRLQFGYFSVGVSRTKCSYGSDYVTIRDGGYSTSLLLKSLCGSRIPTPIQSLGNIMRVTLKSANNIRQAGFSATWKSVLTPTIPPTVKPSLRVCGGTLSHTQGTITSPNHPGKYPSSKTCIWIITVSVHKVLKLRFTSFNLESGERCKYDYVEIRDGPTLGSRLLGKFCGNTLPKPITAFANSLWIKFHSDTTLGLRGFRAVYETEKRVVVKASKPCPKRWRHYISEDDGQQYCYLIRYRRASWNSARDDCRRKKSDLLSIATSKEQWFVRNELMAETKYYELWMGYNDLRSEGQWAWSDRSEVNFKNWGGGDPNNGGRRNNEDCGVVKPDGKWNDFPCNHRFMYICKRKIS